MGIKKRFPCPYGQGCGNDRTLDLLEQEFADLREEVHEGNATTFLTVVEALFIALLSESTQDALVSWLETWFGKPVAPWVQLFVLAVVFWVIYFGVKFVASKLGYLVPSEMHKKKEVADRVHCRFFRSVLTDISMAADIEDDVNKSLLSSRPVPDRCRRQCVVSLSEALFRLECALGVIGNEDIRLYPNITTNAHRTLLKHIGFQTISCVLEWGIETAERIMQDLRDVQYEGTSLYKKAEEAKESFEKARQSPIA